MFEGLGKIPEMNSLGGEINDFGASTAQASFPTFKPNDSEEPAELSSSQQSSSASTASNPNPLTSPAPSVESVTSAGSMASTATASASASTIAVGATVGAAITGVVTTAITTTVAVLFMARIQEERAYVYADPSEMTIEYSLEVEYNKAGTLYAELSSSNQVIELQEYELVERSSGEGNDFPEEEADRPDKSDYPFIDYMWGKFGADDESSLLLDTPYDLQIYYLDGENKNPVYRKSGIVLSINAYIENFFWTSETGSKAILYSYDVYYKEPISLGHRFITNTGEALRLYDNDVSLEPSEEDQPDEKGYYMSSVEGVYESDVDFEDYVFEVMDLSTYNTIFESTSSISTSPLMHYIDGFDWSSDSSNRNVYYSYDVYYKEAMALGHYLSSPEGELIDLGNEIQLTTDMGRLSSDAEGFYVYRVSGVYHSDIEFSNYSFEVRDMNAEDPTALFISEPVVSMTLPDFVVDNFQWSGNLDGMNIIFSYTIRYRADATIHNYLVTDEGALINVEKETQLFADGATSASDEDGYYSALIEHEYKSSADFRNYSLRVIAEEGSGETIVFESDPVIETSSSVYASLKNPTITLDSDHLVMHISTPIEFSYPTEEKNASLMMSVYQTGLDYMESVASDEASLDVDNATVQGDVYTIQYEKAFFGLSANVPYTLEFRLFMPSVDKETVIYHYEFELVPEGDVEPYFGLTGYYTIGSGGSSDSSYVGEEGYTYLDFDFCSNGIEGATYCLAAYNPSGSQIGDTVDLSVDDFGSYVSAAVRIFNENAQPGDSADIEILYRKVGDSSFTTLSRHTIYFK